jgi:hypothetical protein
MVYGISMQSQVVVNFCPRVRHKTPYSVSMMSGIDLGMRVKVVSLSNDEITSSIDRGCGHALDRAKKLLKKI